MPKNLTQLANGKANVKKAGGQLIDFTPIAKAIIASGEYFSVTEVWKSKQMVNKVVTRFRTYKLLNAQVKGRKMMRILDKGLFYYGKFDANFVKTHK